MRNDIRHGAYDLGEWLKLIDLQKRYEATQAEMRRVLSELKAGRLVEHRANYGFRVATLDPKERQQLRLVRVLLERSTAALIAARASERDIASLRKLSKAFEISINKAGRQRQAAANAAFHERLYRIVDNKVLIELIHEMRERGHFGAAGRWRSEEGLLASHVEHEKIIDAIEARDPVELERLIVQHIEAF
jgi:DNA-binding GntR family transcriptional regulator